MRAGINKIYYVNNEFQNVKNKLKIISEKQAPHYQKRVGYFIFIHPRAGEI